MLRGMRDRTLLGSGLIGVLGCVVQLVVAPGLQAQAAVPAVPATSAPPAASAPAATTTAAPAAAPSGGATVYLKNGGLVRGELIELQPGSVARVKLADGKVRDIPWAEIDRVDDPSLPPAPPPDAAPGPTLPGPATPGAGLSPQLAVGSTATADADELKRLRAERDDIDNTGPAVMMILGGGAFIVFGIPGIALLAVGEACDNSSGVENSDCVNVRGAGAVLAVIGVAGGAVAIWGLIKVGHNRDRRNQLDERIQELKGNQAGLSLGLLPRRDGAALGLTLRL
jgi:hypothetical protein